MEGSTVHHLCASLKSADEAWAAASTGGADDIVAVIRAIHTLHYHAQPQSTMPEPGALASVLADATARLRRLRTTLRRLRSVIAGVKRWRAELAPSPLAQLVDRFLDGLSADHADKASVVDALAASAEGSPLDVDRWLAMWGEQTKRYKRPDADFIRAFVEAEQVMSNAAQADSSSPPTRLSELAIADEPRKQLSPALAMLKRKSAAKK